MKKSYFILFIIVLFTFCSKNKNKFITNQNYNDSLNFHIKLYKKESDLVQKNYHIRKILNNLEYSENNKKNRDTLFNLTLVLYKDKNWENFNSISQKLYKKSILAKDSVNIAKFYRYKAGFFKNTMSYDSSFYYYIKSEKIYKTLDDTEGYSTILFNKGIVQYYANDFLGADFSLNRSLSLMENIDDDNKKYGVLNQLGLVSSELKDYDKSIFFLNKALELVKSKNIKTNEHEESVCLSNIGFIFQNQKKYIQAIKKYNEALLDKDMKIDSPYLFSDILDNLAYSKLKLNDFNDLPDLFYKSLKIRDSIDNSTYKVISNTHLSEYYDKIKDAKKSIAFANKALEISKKGKIPIDIVAALKQAAAVDKLNASSYTTEYIRINDSLLTAERKNLDRFARIQLETDEVMKENKALGDKNQNLVYYLLGTILLFSVGFFMYSEKQKQKIFVLKQEQQASNQRIFNLLISQQENSVNIRIEEQKRIAKELHDGVLGRLFGTRLFIDSVNKSNSKEAIEGRSAAIVEMQSIEQQIREISHDMNSEKGKIINNFVGIVIDLLENQKKAYPSELHYSFGVDITWDKLDNFAKINLYRILQESLQNSNKYANAKSIEVLFKEIDEKIVLTITDDGKGFDVNKGKKGIGMSNMKERAEESGGIYEVVSVKNAGTTTTVTLPTNLKQQTTS